MIPSYYHAPDVSEGSDRMRGPDEQTNHMFSYLSPEQRVRADHPLRAIRAMTDRVFADLSPRLTKMYSDIGRPSIPPEQLLRALVLQSLYTVRSERLLMEEIDYSVLYRWFVGLSMDDPIWSPTRAAAAARRSRQSDGEFPWRIAAERHASVHDGSRCHACAEGRRSRGEAVVRGPCPARHRHGLVANVCVTRTTRAPPMA